MAHHKPIAILYHGGCPDGFGAAYAAWKKFGDAADYIPVKHQEPPPLHLDGKELYLVDFCYDQETMDSLIKIAKSVAVIDHHEGVEDVIKSIPDHLYSTDHSGATLSWQYFNPDKPTPLFLTYVEDVDLFRKIPDDERALITYAYVQPFHFEMWDGLVRRTEDPHERVEMVTRGTAYQEYFQLLSHQLAGSAELVEFEGHICYLVAGEKMFITDLGNKLREKRPPLALVVRAGATGLRVSIRSDDSVDAAALAQKYGGNGHHNSAAFSLPWGTPIPWKPVEEPTA